jgi:hypothetical protein
VRTYNIFAIVPLDAPLLEKILVDLLDMEGLLNSAPDIVADHEHR